jgi:hypothetical protein
MINIVNNGEIVDVEFDGNTDEVLKELIEAVVFALFDLANQTKIKPEELLRAFGKALNNDADKLIEQIKKARYVE